MKNILILLLIVLSCPVFSQISNTKVVRIANASTVFSQPLSEGNILIDLSTDKSYLILKGIPGTASLSTLVVDVDYKEFQTGGTPSVGVLYISGSQITYHAEVGTYYAIANFTAGAANNMTATDSSLTVPSTGIYDVRWSISCTHAINNTVVHTSVFINEVENNEIEAERKIGTGGDYGNYGSGGIVSLTASDVIKLKTRASNAGNQTINAANLSIKRIN